MRMRFARGGYEEEVARGAGSVCVFAGVFIEGRGGTKRG